MNRRAIGVGASIMLLLVSGCGAKPKTTLSVAITGDPAAPTATQRFNLRCDPTGGDMPNRAALCKVINARPLAMLFPGRSHAACAAGFKRPPVVSVEGSYRQHRVRFAEEIACRWPGSIAALP